MSKPIRSVEIETPDGRKRKLLATFDTGSFYTIIREDRLPKAAQITRFRRKEHFGTARKGARLEITGVVALKLRIASHLVRGESLVAPLLGAEMLVGAGLMQMWDISIRNRNGHTTIHIGRDMNDPDIQTVL